MDEAVEHDDGGDIVGNEIVSACNRNLRGDQCGFSAVALLDDFEEMEALLVGERACPEVVENEQLSAESALPGRNPRTDTGSEIFTLIDTGEPSIVATSHSPSDQIGHHPKMAGH